MPITDPAAVARPPARWRARVGFGVGSFGVSLVYTASGLLQLYFYTRVLGISAAQSGTILFIGALGDALIDPLVGWLASHTRTRWGRYRPYLIFGAIPMSLAFIATYLNLGLSGHAVFWYALCSLALFRMSFQLIYMPYTSLIVVLSRDADERSEIESYRAWFIAAGSLAVSVGGLMLVAYLGNGDDARGFLRLAILIGILSAASFLLSGFVTREITADNPVKDMSNPIAVARLLFLNDQFLVVVIGTVLAQSAYAMVLSACVNFFEAFLGHRELARWPLVASTAAGLVASFIWPAISRRYGKGNTWLAGMLIAAAALLLLFAMEPHTIGPYIVGFFVMGCGIQAGIVMQFAAAADSLDYGEWKTGFRTEAIGFALMTCAMKMSLAVGNGLVGWLFAAAGFVAREVPSAHTIEGMRITFLAVPAAGFVAAAAIIKFYKISASDHGRYISEVTDRRRIDGAPESPTAMPVREPKKLENLNALS